jgi:ABC-type transporter Mla MlaB component
MSDSDRQSGGEDQIQINGELTFNSTPEIYRQKISHFQQDWSVMEVDLGGVDRSDSSGLALLLEWQAMAKQKKRTLRIINSPANLLMLAKLCEADILLNITGR